MKRSIIMSRKLLQRRALRRKRLQLSKSNVSQKEQSLTNTNEITKTEILQDEEAKKAQDTDYDLIRRQIFEDTFFEPIVNLWKTKP